MIPQEHIALAQKLRDYNHLNHVVKNVDCILVFGSHDLRVAERGAELFLDGIAPYILFSGGLGRLTEGSWQETEAEKFANIAIERGVPRENILLESSSTNSSENVLFSMRLLEETGISHKKLLIVHKPYMERRAYATFKKHFPDQDVLVTSQDVSLLDYVNDKIGLEKLINLLVGDTQRILVYPEKGFQIKQEVPEDVVGAMEQLIEWGYDEQLIGS